MIDDHYRQRDLIIGHWSCISQPRRKRSPTRSNAMSLPLQVLSESDPEHLLKFYGVCLWEGRLTLVTELMKVQFFATFNRFLRDDARLKYPHVVSPPTARLTFMP